MRVGDQKGNARALSWQPPAFSRTYLTRSKEFAAAAPLLEALSAGAIETGWLEMPPFALAAAAKVAGQGHRRDPAVAGGLGILAPETSAVNKAEANSQQIEPVLPVERKPIGFSLGIGIVLLVVLVALNHLFQLSF